MTSSEIVHSARTRLGPVGVWLGVLGRAPIDEERRAARLIEELGYGSIWTPEGIGGKEAFAHQSVLLAATRRIATGTGIANVWARHPATMQGGAATLGAAYPGRFVLGVGVSHAPAVERSGQAYVKPLQHMARYLDAMDAAAATAPATEVPVARVLAALRPNMLALSRDRADGAHPYFVPVAHTPMARKALGPDKLLIPEQAVVVNTDPDEARRIARDHMRGYLQLPNYVNNLKHLGNTDEDVSGGGSDRLVDAIVAWGDEANIARRVREHLDGGADHVLLQPLGDLDAALRQLESLAPAVLGN
ncbi:MAG: TIGR03620 family F420-dependent LLM class oxidoreductase [Chloroflexota bacterium]|nr:TIGR03620 family F420-dependent LLM class oxidoreductase [Chloroflexota bacterium]